MGFLSVYTGTQRIVIDEDRNYWVDVKKYLTQGEKEASERALVPMVVRDGKPVVNPDVTSYRQHLILAHIAAWNLDDDNGTVWPIDMSHVKQLPGEIYDRLWVEIDGLGAPRTTEERLQFRDGDVVGD